MLNQSINFGKDLNNRFPFSKVPILIEQEL